MRWGLAAGSVRERRSRVSYSRPIVVEELGARADFEEDFPAMATHRGRVRRRCKKACRLGDVEGA